MKSGLTFVNKFGRLLAPPRAGTYRLSQTMKTKILITAAVLFSFAGFAQSVGGDKLRTVKNETFDTGEKLTYRVHYGMVTAGIAKLEIKDEPVMVNGRKCFHAVGTGTSSRTFSAFYRVADRYESFIDMQTLSSVKFKRKISEGNFRQYTEVDFNQDSHKAVERKNGQEHTTEYDVPPYIQDVMSAFYFARTQDYTDARPGDLYHFQNFIDRKVFDLDVLFIGRETIEVEGKTYSTVKLKPLVQEGGLFQHEGDMFLWISDDANRIPVRVESAIVVGAITVDLKKAEGLKHPFTAQIK